MLPAPRGTTARLATMPPSVTFRFDAVGTAVPHGNAVRNPGPQAPTAVRLTATPTAPAGSPPTGTARTRPGPTLAVTASPSSARLSTRRTGVTGWKPPLTGAPSTPAPGSGAVPLTAS